MDPKMTSAADLAAVLTDPHLLGDLARQLTCAEANTFARFIAAWNGTDLATRFLTAHADEDSELEGDEHWNLAGLSAAIEAL